VDTLGHEFEHPLIYVDNYEIIAQFLRINNWLASTKEEEKRDNARKINSFLENLPANTAVLLTSRERYNLDGERPVRLNGLSETEGRDLFIELAKNHFPKGREPSEEVRRVLEEISKKAGGHPLSIELLARSYRGGSMAKLKVMLEHMGVGITNSREETERLKSLGSCFEYSFETIPQTHRDLLAELTFFNSPFPADALEKIFGFEGSSEILLDLYERSLLRRIEFDEYSSSDEDGVDPMYHLYYFHPAIRNYLDRKVVGGQNRRDLQERYGERLSLYYHKLIEQTYNAIGTKNHGLSLERFNVIIQQGRDNDFVRAIGLAKDRSVASDISTGVGLLLEVLGIYGMALEFLNNALAISKDPQDEYRLALGYSNIGLVLYRQGNYDEALQYYKKALQLHEERQDTVGMATDYTDIGAALSYQGNYSHALEYLEKALALDEELQNASRMAEDYAGIANVLANIENRKTAAIDSFSKGLQILKVLEEKTGYHDPLSDEIQQNISELQRENEIANNNNKKIL
jgi:tetratricopeptide (TPR) repeat protein